jgi:hypothetical protein
MASARNICAGSPPGGFAVHTFHIRRVVLGLSLAANLFAVAGHVAAAGPVAVPLSESFVDLNPCTGEPHTITVTGTLYILDRGNGFDYRIDRVVTTSSGFSGGGNEVGIHDRIFKVEDILANAEGDIILANARVISDPAGTVHVDTVELTCVSGP